MIIMARMDGKLLKMYKLDLMRLRLDDTDEIVAIYCCHLFYGILRTVTPPPLKGTRLCPFQ